MQAAEDSPNLVKYAALLVGLFVVVAFGLRPAIRLAGKALATQSTMKSARRELPAGSSAGQAQVPLSAPEPAEIDPSGCGRRRSSNR